MMAKNSCEKGKRGEREAAEVIRRVLRVEARRGQQHAGGSDSPDVAHGLPGLHIEVKRTERLQLRAAMEQAIADAAGAVPLVMHRANRTEWLATVRFDDLPRLAALLWIGLTEDRSDEDLPAGGIDERL